jgi:two-component system, NtrC family, sensor kinase
MISKNLLFHAVEALNDGVVITDETAKDSPIIYANPGFERLTNYRKEEILGLNCRFLQGNHKNQDDLLILRRSIKRKQPCLVKLQNYKKTGELFWNELSMSPVFDDNGKLINFIGIQKMLRKR